MFKRIIIIFAAWFCLFIFISSSAFAFWVWSPRTKKFENPRWTAKQTPKEQFDFAKSLFDLGEFKKAYDEFKKVIKFFPNSFEAAESQFYIGACYEKLDKPYQAYLAYQKVIDKYPFNNRMETILEREFNIASILAKSKSKVLGITFPSYYLAIEIYEKIIANAPYSKWAPMSQYQIGMVLKSAGRFSEAKEQLQKVIDDYPESEWVEPAKYEIAITASKASLAADYDQRLTKEAKERFQTFVENNQDEDLKDNAQQMMVELEDKEAEKDFGVAQFYEKQKEYKSAVIYYESILSRYSRSKWAQRALERLQLLEKEGKIK